MVNLVDVYSTPGSFMFLYQLLLERPEYANISHKKIPTYEEHLEFVRSHPYLAWFIAMQEWQFVGSAYLTVNKEIGIAVKKEYQGNGYAKQIIENIIKLYGTPLYANIAPGNFISQNMFERQFGFKHIQNTYKLGD